MKTIITILAATVLALAPACGSLGTKGQMTISTVTERQIDRICDRHDDYVAADEALGEDTALEYLQRSEDVRELVDAAMMVGDVDAGVLWAPLSGVLERHDLYVLGDGSLIQLERDSYLGESYSVRDRFTIEL